MRPLVTSADKAWKLGGWIAALALVLVAIALVPPGSLPYPPDSDYSDAAISHWPNTYFLRESIWKYGQWPLWNPLRMLGLPFSANPLSKVWYPPQWLGLLLPPTIHLNMMIYLHMAWLALGMFAWLRSERVHLSAAFLATIAWGLNPKLIAHLGAGHLDIVYALAWVPWLLWAAGHIVDTPSMGWGALAGGIAALLVLADMRIAFYMLPVAGIYALAATVARRRLLSGSWKAWALAVMVLLLLTAVQTIPLLAISPYLTRALLTPLEAAEFSLPLRYLLGVLFPNLGGFHEWMTYLGLPVIGLALVALIGRTRDHRAWLWWGVAILALLWALGEEGPLFLLIVEHLPLAGWFRVPSRSWLIVVLSLIIAGMYGLERILDHGLGRRGRLIVLAVAFAGAVWLLSALVLSGLPGVIAGAGAALFGTGSGLWLAGGGMSDLSALFDPSACRRSRFVGIAVLLVTLTLSLLSVDVTLVRAQSMTEIEAPEQAIIDKIDGRCGAVYSPTFELIGPATARADLATLHGVDPFQLQWSAENIAAAAGVESDRYSVIAPPLPPGELDPKNIDLDVALLKTLSVCWIVSKPGISIGGLPVYAQIDDVMIYRLPSGQPEMPLGYYLAARSSMGANTFKAEICTDVELTHVVIPQAWAPGWQTQVDGHSASVVAWKGLLVVGFEYVPGCHTIEAVYRPLADFIGMGMTGITVSVLLVWAIIRRRKEANRA